MKKNILVLCIGASLLVGGSIPVKKNQKVVVSADHTVAVANVVRNVDLPCEDIVEAFILYGDGYTYLTCDKGANKYGVRLVDDTVVVVKL